MTSMSDHQVGLARHALGLPHRSRCSYRNRYVVAAENSDFREWLAMVAAGFALRHRSRWNDGSPMYVGGAVLFTLTRAGAEAALQPGEQLDPEDFPAEVAHA